MSTPLLEIRASPGKGRGVFARIPIQSGRLLLVDPVFTFKTADLPPTALDDYRMGWSEEEDCIALGMANIINHDEDPNVIITDDLSARTKRVTSVRFIPAGGELLVTYRCPIWW
jgi:hypothetical protein